MVDQLLWIDALAKFVVGGLLTFAPKSALLVFGLPRTNQPLYPRLLGLMIVALAGALFIEGADPASNGLGLRGAVVVNLTVAAGLTLIMILPPSVVARRGRYATWLAIIFLVLLSVVESLYA